MMDAQHYADLWERGGLYKCGRQLVKQADFLARANSSLANA